MVCRIVLLGCIIAQGSLSTFAAAPDLVVWGPSLRPYIDSQTFSSTSCEVREGCVAAGTRRLLRFETESRNYGDADLVFGDPRTNPLFEHDPCHNHYHFGQFTEYRLLTEQGAVALNGKKIGFCLEDTVKWDPAAGPQRYNCDFQGIQRGWADRYTYNVPCQFLDITGLAPGTYILDITVDPLNFIPELDESNNNIQVPIQIPPVNCTTPPPNNSFAAAQQIYAVPQTIYGQNNCATKESGERNHAGNIGGRSVWYRWTAPFTRQVLITTEGSSFDTLLAAYSFVGPNLNLMAENDDVVHMEIQHSEIRFTVQAGTEYRIVVDGFDGAFGSIVLNFDPPANDDFTGCQTLTGATGTAIGHNIGATRESNEPTHASTFGSHSIWYCWTAPRTGTVEWSTIGSDFDTSLAVYRGSALNALTPIASDNDSGAGGGTSVLRFTATSNLVYRIAIDGRANDMGNTTLRWAYLSGRLAIRRNSSGPLVITITGANGTYNLQASSNLVSWANVGTVTVSNGTGTSTQPNNTSRRFYRAILPTP